MRFKIDWASLIVGRKLTVFALFYFVFEGNFPSTRPRGAYILMGDLTEVFLRYRLGGLHLEGLIFGILRCLSSLLSFLVNSVHISYRKSWKQVCFPTRYIRAELTRNDKSLFQALFCRNPCFLYPMVLL